MNFPKVIGNSLFISFILVLVAHGGFDNDFMMIQSNLERNEMSLDLLNQNNLCFGDTYLLCRKVYCHSMFFSWAFHPLCVVLHTQALSQGGSEERYSAHQDQHND